MLCYLARKRKQLLLGSKLVSFVVILAAAFSGHPPSGAQSVPWSTQTPQIAAEDMRQDTEIGNLKTQNDLQSVALTAMQSTLNKQGEDLARLDTKMTLLCGFLGLLQGGGIMLSFKKGSE